MANSYLEKCACRAATDCVFYSLIAMKKCFHSFCIDSREVEWQHQRRVTLLAAATVTIDCTCDRVDPIRMIERYPFRDTGVSTVFNPDHIIVSH